MNIQQIKSKIIPVLRRYDIVKAAIFGSIVTGQAKKNSDIDILIQFRGKKSLLDLVDLKMKLEKLLHREVDVLTYNSLNPLLRERILNEKKEIL